jgi:nucleoside-diphosphate-sugar epimerase
MSRRHILESFPQFVFKKVALEDYDALEKIFAEYKIDKVCHLAAQA